MVIAQGFSAAVAGFAVVVFCDNALAGIEWFRGFEGHETLNLSGLNVVYDGFTIEKFQELPECVLVIG